MSDWRTRAACIEHRDWWPLRQSSAPRPYADEREAMTICVECPVLAQCDALAEVVRPVCGVWAGRVWRADRDRAGTAHSGIPIGGPA